MQIFTIKAASNGFRIESLVLITYKPAEQYKNTVRFLLFTTPDRSMYAFFDPFDNTVHLIDYIKVDTSDVELLWKQTTW